MNKFKIFYFTLGLFGCIICVSGCVRHTVYVPVTDLTAEECRNVPDVWYGQRGVDPSNNKVWKCNDWILMREDLS